jgi:hypothetical protein
LISARSFRGPTHHGGKRIRTLGPRYVDDAFETILIPRLAFAFLPERPARSQGGTGGSNPLSSSRESIANLFEPEKFGQAIGGWLGLSLAEIGGNEGVRALADGLRHVYSGRVIMSEARPPAPFKQCNV